MAAKLTLYDFLRIGHVKRWHNVNMIRSQTVAEHCFMVMLIALHLFDRIIGVRDERKLALLLVSAMFHDAPEVAAGDTPTPAKRLLREITKDQALFDKLDKHLMPELPYVGGTIPDDLEYFIKMADKIEAYHFVHDNGSGAHAQIVLNTARRGLEDLCLKYDDALPEMNWITHVNEILTAMGLPYVHKESRISPP